MTRRIQLGDEVKDTVTGFQGVVTSTTLFLNGCTRCGIQPPVGKDGKVPEAISFDEPQLKLIKANKVVAENASITEDRKGPMPTRTGGPISKAERPGKAPRQC